MNPRDYECGAQYKCDGCRHLPPPPPAPTHKKIIQDLLEDIQHAMFRHQNANDNIRRVSMEAVIDGQTYTVTVERNS